MQFDLTTFLKASNEVKEVIAEHMSEKDVYHLVLAQKEVFLKAMKQWQSTLFGKKYFTYFINRSFQQNLDIEATLKRHAKKTLKRLNFSKLKKNQIQKMIKHLPVCEELEEIVLKECYDLDNALLSKLLAKAPQLKRLDLSNAQKISRIDVPLYNLQRLNLNSTNIDAKALMSILSQTKHLYALDISYTNKIDQINPLPLGGLKELDCSMSALNEEGLRAFLSQANLLKLNCFHCEQLEGVAFFHLSKKLMLRELNFAVTKLNDKALEKVLEIAPDLQTLILFSCSSIKGKAFVHAKRPLALKALNLSKTPILDRFIAPILQNCPHLKTLHLGNCPVQLNVLNAFSAPFALEHLNISQTRVTNEALYQWTSLCPDLKILNVHGCEKISIDSIDFLIQLKYLEEVDLRKVAKRELFLPHLDHFTYLKSWLI
jgi:hypothetical protein